MNWAAKLTILLIGVLSAMTSCRLTPQYLPDAGGNTLTAVPFGESGCPFGFYEYLPEGYGLDSSIKYPLLIFLHGAGERGDSERDPEELDKLLSTGLPALIRAGQFDPPEPMIVLALQANIGFDQNNLHKAIKWAHKTYLANPSRTYMTGLSMGAYATYRYLGSYGKRSLVAAAVVICGGAPVKRANRIGQTPLWIFHGDADEIVSVSESFEIAKALGDQAEVKPFNLSIYPGVDHRSWDMTYDGTGMGKEDPDYDRFDKDIYSWMLQYRRD
jgi:predicted peptidase